MAIASSSSTRHIITWLFTCIIMVAVMVAIGGLTRLTESGLSIVEWKPVAGAIPPLSEEAWRIEFEKYQQTPEYLKVNRHMQLAEFKAIFWMEYLHRLAGRLTGLIFFVPFLYFLVKGHIRGGLALRLGGILLLGGLQGAIGWYMVKSGLQDQPDVSHYRLALHLFTAFLILGLLLITMLKVMVPRPRPDTLTSKALRLHSHIAVGAILLQVISGAFVAGLNAGLIYNSFPLMGGKFIPDDIGFFTPWYKDLLENVATVQFTHRILAGIVTLIILSLYIHTRMGSTPGACKKAVNILVLVLIIQVILGIATLVHQVPIALASLHQMGAVLLFSIALINSYLCSIYSNRGVEER